MASRIRSFFSAPRCRRHQAGAAIVETLIFVPMIFLLTFLTLEVTNVLRVYESMSWTAEYAVRQASEGTNPFAVGTRHTSEALLQKVTEKIMSLPIDRQYIDSRDVVCIIYFRENETPSDSDFSCIGSFSGEADFHPGDFVRVRVRLHYKPMLSDTLFKWMFPNGAFTMSSTFDRVISAESGLSPPPPPDSTPPPRSR